MNDRSENRLKAIAGLIQRLTYSEMNTLAKLIAEDVDNEYAQTVPEGLLKISERILATKEDA